MLAWWGSCPPDRRSPVERRWSGSCTSCGLLSEGTEQVVPHGPFWVPHIPMSEPTDYTGHPVVAVTWDATTDCNMCALIPQFLEGPNRSFRRPAPAAVRRGDVPCPGARSQ